MIGADITVNVNGAVRAGGELLRSGGAIGVDPGSATGSIAYVSFDATAQQVFAWPIARMTEQEVCGLLLALGRTAGVAAIERVGPMPKQGVSSSFKFGASYGGLRMALAASGVVWHQVAPLTWQNAMKCRSGGDKRVTRARAQQLWPALRVTHAVADSLLIALYARQHLLGDKPRPRTPREELDALLYGA